ncbi:MAG: ATP-binding protein, partial [Pseudomonadota bacterium]|nr:ATP-binding protein [Pseudomonadota bacterium]
HAPERLQVTVAHGIPLLWCDALLVTQTLDNLLDNACKFSPPDSKVQLSVRSESDGVIFAVSDEGPGIPQELQQQIFLPFQQGQALAWGVKAAKRSGVGIGLALCRSVAVAHGGELRLHSSEAGSRFEFSLPHKPQPIYPAAADDGKAT